MNGAGDPFDCRRRRAKAAGQPYRRRINAIRRAGLENHGAAGLGHARCRGSAWGCVGLQPGCVGLQVMVRVAAASRAYGRSLRLRASSQAHYGVDEDEEWWPGRACSACTHRARTPWPLRRRRARAPTLTVTPNPNPNPSPNTNPNPNPNQASPSSLGRRGACGCRGPCRSGLIVCLSSRRFDRCGVCATSWFALRFCFKTP